MMTSYQANWEDKENNRSVELVVNYRLDAAEVEIEDVTPTRVTFQCPTTRQSLRSVGVWTEGGRRMLARQMEAAGRLATLPKEIADGRLVEIKHELPARAGAMAPVLQA